MKAKHYWLSQLKIIWKRIRKNGHLMGKYSLKKWPSLKWAIMSSFNIIKVRDLMTDKVSSVHTSRLTWLRRSKCCWLSIWMNATSTRRVSHEEKGRNPKNWKFIVIWVGYGTITAGSLALPCGTLTTSSICSLSDDESECTESEVQSEMDRIWARRWFVAQLVCGERPCCFEQLL